MKNNNNKNLKKNHRMYVIESTNTRKNGRWVPVLYLLVFRKEISDCTVLQFESMN